MNKLQKIIIYVALTAMTLIGLFPPWHVIIPQGSRAKQVINLGYSFIGKPPVWNQNSDFGGKITLPTLLVQWGIVAGLAAGLVYLQKKD